MSVVSLSIFHRYFKRLLFFFSDQRFYTAQVHLPAANTLSANILDDPRFRFFDRCVGAVD
ncbi:hypothetical protein M405DRAFT_752963 [Rhizopogon salebrosus TDB-379]|nr:hypothetical protein M405DRAFT_752963 [Rhizopogon salebrosus TDB-379]